MSNALVEGKYFRVSRIVKIVDINENGIVTEPRPIYHGLSIERKQGEHYYVVSHVRLGFENHVELFNVEFRPIEIIDESMSMEDFWEMMHEYRNCVEFAKHTLEDILNENRVF